LPAHRFRSRAAGMRVDACAFPVTDGASTRRVSNGTKYLTARSQQLYPAT
jgi:hypothetical protein